MLKLQLATKADLREAAIIQQKRRFEQERKERIFNAQNRLLGVDLSGLERQISEKRERQQQQDEEERRFVAEQERRCAVVTEKEAQLNQERRRIESEINDYRRNFQKKEDCREFDLNDPRQMQKSFAARIGDNDPRLGISSAQKFLGEDLMQPERIQAQKDQQRAWLQQQIKQRQQTENDRTVAEHRIQAALESRDRRAVEMDFAERETRRQIKESIAKFNLEMAASKECQRLTRRRHEQEDNMAEVYNCLTSDMLMESKDCAKSNLGTSRIITANYRGMTDAEIENIKLQQQNQLQELKKRRDDENETELKWEQMTNNFARNLKLKNREMERNKRSQNQQVQNENDRLAAEQKARQDYFNNIVYTNQPTENFFTQFNTTSR